MEYNCFITVRSSSSRLKKKCFLDFGNITVLEHIILRCIYGGLTPIVCTTTKKADEKIIKIAKLMNIKYFKGSEQNKILRWHSCSLKFNINIFHTVDADDLFFDWDAIKKSLNLLKRLKKDVILPSKISRNGGASEGYSFTRAGIKKMIKTFKNLKKKNYNSEMIDNYIKCLNSTGLKGQNYQIKNTRMTLDYKEDYKFLKKLRNNLGNFSHRNKINLFLKKNKKLRNINFFRNSDWKIRQNFLIEKTS